MRVWWRIGDLTVQLVRYLGDFAALVAGALQFIGGWLTGAVSASDRGSALGRAAGDFFQSHLPGVTVVEADDHHAEMQQIRDHAE